MNWHLPFNPYDVQKKAAQLLGTHGGYALFMEMGLGKTACAVNDFIDAYRNDQVRQMLVLCPAHLRGNWFTEIEKYGIPCIVSVAPNFPSEHNPNLPRIWIVNYEVWRSSVGPHVEAWVKQWPTMIVADESQNIKNYKSKVGKWAVQLAKQCPVRRILSGKPMSQNVLDLWPQLRFIGALNGVNPIAFRNEFAVMGGYMGKVIVGVRNEDRLNRILDEWSFRATKDEWLDLPAKLPARIIEVEMKGEQKAAYDKMRKEQFLLLEKKGIEITADMVISAMMKLQQISSGWIYDEHGHAHDLMEPKDNPKINALFAELEAAEGKSLVFCHYKHSMETLITEFDRRYDDDIAIIQGGQPRGAIEEYKKMFNENPDCRVLFGQIAAAKEGHTLLGGPGRDRCSNTFYFENTYSLNDRAQSEDRNHRIGQDKPVSYTDFVASPIERRIITALQKKEDIVRAVMQKKA